MKKIIVSGITTKFNFGGPSLLLGFIELIKSIYGDQFELVIYQYEDDNKLIINESNVNLKKINLSSKKILLSYYLKKFFNISRSLESNKLIGDIKGADFVVDLYGIKFCDNLDVKKPSFYNILLASITQNIVAYIAHKENITVIKNTASFGPMKSKYNRRLAKLTCNKIYSKISAREEMSREALLFDAGVKKNIFISPDTANLMTFEKPLENISNTIGISISHKIIAEWKNEDSYIDCIVHLCSHIKRNIDRKIVLIPNEFNEKFKINDVVISKEIQDRLKKQSIEVSILDVVSLTSKELKNSIASCDLFIGSRYHSCVASLSSGVPTLVIGWHNKYIELMKWYNQSEWQLSSNDCSKKSLVTIFDSFWDKRNDIKEILSERSNIVKQEVIRVGSELLGYGS